MPTFVRSCSLLSLHIIWQMTESSNPEVATVVDGYLRPADGVTSGETTITVMCDYLEASITVVLQVVN